MQKSNTLAGEITADFQIMKISPLNIMRYVQRHWA